MIPAKSVFIVEDDPIEVFLSVSELSKLPSLTNIKSAVSLGDALKLYESDFVSNNIHPDIILLDLKLSFEEGWDFITKISSLHPTYYAKTKTFILTSSHSRRDVKKAKEFNVAGYIQKPFTIQKLIAALTCEHFILVV